MLIETRFALGQQVHRIGRHTHDPVKLPCKFCRGSRRVRVDSPAGNAHHFVSCPSCKGTGAAAIATKTLFAYIGETTIGSIEVRLIDPNVPGYNGGPRSDWQTVDPNGHLREERYMASQGFPSGSVFRSVETFASKAEAEEEIERRNEDIASGRSWKPTAEEAAKARAFLEHADVYEHTAEHLAAARDLISAFEFVDDEVTA